MTDPPFGDNEEIVPLHLNQFLYSGPAEQVGPGGLWPIHRSNMVLPPTGVWQKIPENVIGD